MIQSRYMGAAKSWLPGKRHSYVKVISNEESGDFKIELQNEKFKVKTFKLGPRVLIALTKANKFMGV